MSLSEGQLLAISIAERTCSAVSLLSAGAAVLTFLTWKAFRTPINRLIFYALCGNIVLNIATLISKSGVDHGVGSPLCSFQAFLIQWLFPADALWALCIAWNVYLRFFYRYDSKQLRRLEWKYVLFCYVMPFIPALTLLFIRTRSRGRVYGSGLFECWIALSWDSLRIALLYGPVWLVIAVITIIYTRVGLYIYSHLKHLRALGMTGDWTEDVNRIADASTTEMHEMTSTPFRAYHGHSQADETSASRQQTSSTHSINRRARELVRVGSDSNMAAWAYARYSFLFFIALLVTWVPSTINRLSTLINPQYLSFGMNYAAAFVIPLQGFWNSVIYFTISRREFKALSGHRETSQSNSARIFHLGH